MRFFRYTLWWTAIFAFAFSSAHVSRIQADPTDDFSFSLNQTPEIEIYYLMSTRRVKSILLDYLVGFPAERVPELAQHLVRLCRQHRFDPAFILSLIEVESRFQVRAKSPRGATGLLQVMPATARAVARDWNLGPVTEHSLLDPFTNLTIGIAYLAQLRERYRDLPMYYLLAAYNLGPARLDHLLSKKGFRPDKTARYFQKIRSRIQSSGKQNYGLFPQPHHNGSAPGS